MTLPPADFDSPWKEALERYFQDFMAFFFPAAHAGIDWTRGYTFLDKELQQVQRDAELGRRLVDKLAQVWRQDGGEAWVLAHVEVQGQPEAHFAERLYVYNYRLYDHYRRPVASLVVLGDEQPNWRPERFGYALWGCEVSIQFPVVKLLDYRERWDELEASRNPFATVVMAHLKTQETRRDGTERCRWKLSLTRRLYEQGYEREEILHLFHFIDWLMVLPEELERSFWDTLEQYEEEKRMPYVTSVERIGRQKGREEGREEGILQKGREDVIDILEVRFERVPGPLRDRIQEIEDPDRLKSLHRQALLVEALEEFARMLPD